MDAIKQRIHALEALAKDRGATPAESSTAKRIASKLRQKYGIDHDAIVGPQEAPQGPQIEVAGVQPSSVGEPAGRLRAGLGRSRVLRR